MFDLIFAVLAIGINAADGAVGAQGAEAGGAVPLVVENSEAPKQALPAPTSPNVTIAKDSVVVGEGVLANGVSAGAVQVTPVQAPVAAPSAAFNMAVVPAGLVADAQIATGKFTTATEVKPILEATKGNWVAVREYGGKDLLYVTHLWGWRCGLHAIAISVNNEPMQNWPLPACHMKFTTPNAILEGDGQPYLSMRLGAVETITIQVVYDDLSMDVASFERGNVMTP